MLPDPGTHATSRAGPLRSGGAAPPWPPPPGRAAASHAPPGRGKVRLARASERGGATAGERRDLIRHVERPDPVALGIAGGSPDRSARRTAGPAGEHREDPRRHPVLDDLAVE